MDFLHSHTLVNNSNLNKIEKILESTKKKIDDTFSERVNKINFTLDKGDRNEDGDSNLRLLITDALLEKFKIDEPVFSICNPGGIRVEKIDKGEITKKDIIDAVPFFNSSVLTTLSGKNIYKLFENSIKSGYGKLAISGLKVHYNNEKKITLITDEKDNKLNKDDQKHRAVLSDFLYNCGDHYFDGIYSCKNGKNTKDVQADSESPIFNQVIDFLKKLDPEKLKKYEKISEHYILS
jgi:2',3'-cyclic-nucleotide 2'-phosphodiesterase (5'-nucleotidase family)